MSPQTEEQQLAAVVAAINARYPAERPRAVDSDTAAKDPRNKIVVSLYRRFVAPTRRSGIVTVSAGRITTQYAAALKATVSDFRGEVRAALEEQILPGDLGPIAFESSTATEPDGDLFVGSDTWTF